MKSTKASEFKVRFFQLLNEFAADGEAITISKSGYPVAQLSRVRNRPTSLFGAHAGQIQIIGDIIDPLEGNSGEHR